MSSSVLAVDIWTLSFGGKRFDLLYCYKLCHFITKRLRFSTVLIGQDNTSNYLEYAPEVLANLRPGEMAVLLSINTLLLSVL